MRECVYFAANPGLAKRILVSYAHDLVEIGGIMSERFYQSRTTRRPSLQVSLVR